VGLQREAGGARQGLLKNEKRKMEEWKRKIKQGKDQALNEGDPNRLGDAKWGSQRIKNVEKSGGRGTDSPRPKSWQTFRLNKQGRS